MNYFKKYGSLFLLITGFFLKSSGIASPGSISSHFSFNNSYKSVPLLFVGPPTLRCASVDLDGDVTLNWLQPSDPSSSFDSYHIYASNNINGPYAVIYIENSYAVTSYIHTGAGANTNPMYYYIQTRYNDPPPNLFFSPSSDTLSTIKLNVADPGNGKANLTWNKMHSPDLPSSSVWYMIYMEYPVGTWTLIDSTQSLSYIDTFSICSSFINYRVGIEDASGCSSFSSVDGQSFSDITGPAITVVDSVSVDPVTGITTIGWTQNPSPDVVYYVIYVNNTSQSPPWVGVDTVYGISNTFANVTGSENTCAGTYSIAAFDSCNLTSLISIPHKKICLNQEYDQCGLTLTLTWNKYINWTGGVQQYQILASTNGTPYNLIGTTPPDDTTFLHSGLVASENYCYIVRAIEFNSGRTSTSNKICVNAGASEPPLFAYMKYVTVKSENKIEMACLIDTMADVLKYEIQRKMDTGAHFDSISEVDPLSLSDNVITYIDDKVETGKNSYSYRVVAVDACGNETFISTIGKTILLKAKNDPDAMLNKLEWTDYEYWDGGVDSYNIYRSINGVFDPLPVTNVPYGINKYEDNITDFYASDGGFCYYIEAIEGQGNQYGFYEKSHSNKTCAVQRPNIHIPNAFTPSGSNPVFRPVFSYVDPEEYSLVIFNRSGEKFFETKNLNEGWDGTYKGSMAPLGVYAYHVTYHSASGRPYLISGTVTLLR